MHQVAVLVVPAVQPVVDQFVGRVIAARLAVVAGHIAGDVEFLTDDQVASYGRFNEEPTRPELERFFFLDDEDRKLIAKRRGDHGQLKIRFALQMCTVRYIARPSPLKHRNRNLLGRYGFTASTPTAGALRPPRDPDSPDLDEDDDGRED